MFLKKVSHSIKIVYTYTYIILKHIIIYMGEIFTMFKMMKNVSQTYHTISNKNE